MTCRFCNAELEAPFLDLGMHPSANRLLNKGLLDQINDGSIIEPRSPLRLQVCQKCWLVQLSEFTQPDEIFTDEYVYFSSYAQSWVAHAKRYVDTVHKRFCLDANSWVVEVASNDGYLLQHFNENGIPCTGVDPAGNAAIEAEARGVETIVDFFSLEFATKLVEQRGKADLVLGNNVLAHVPTINDFVAGLHRLLKPSGVVTMEFPHLARLVELTQFDTIYDEHYFYFSLLAVQKIFLHHGLQIFDVEQLSTHGGSLRIFAKHVDNEALQITENVTAIIDMEKRLGIDQLTTYKALQQRSEAIRTDFRTFVDEAQAQGKTIAAFGAAAKGNTFLNYSEVEQGSISLVADDTPIKQGRYLPGSHISIVSEQDLRELRPDYVLILPWNFREEISEKLSYIREWDGKFVTCIPQVEIW